MVFYKIGLNAANNSEAKHSFISSDSSNNNNNNNCYYLLQLGCYQVAVVILHVYEI